MAEKELRQEFEKWAKGLFNADFWPIIWGENVGGYIQDDGRPCNTIEDAWKAWQAAYAAGERAKWIPVEEKLPEVGGTYLVMAKFSEPFKWHVDFGHFFKLETGPSWMTSESRAQAVTHWMPLPEAPLPLSAQTEEIKK